MIEIMSCVKVHLRTNVRVSRLNKVNPALQFYSGIPLMIIDDEHIKEGIGNGTRFISFLCNVGYLIIDGRLVHTLLVLELEDMVYEMIVED